MALRLTILIKLLSTTTEKASKYTSPVEIVDLTDPVLFSTGVDSTIMDIALQTFLRRAGGKKMIGMLPFYTELHTH